MPQEISLHKCLYCNECLIIETEEFCKGCEEKYKMGATIYSVFESIEKLDKQDFNLVTNQHRRILKGSLDKLEAILLVLERYPPREK